MINSDKTIMTWFSKDIVAMFNRLVPDSFEFMKTDYDMTGPENSDPLGYVYRGADYSIHIGLAPRDGFQTIFISNANEREYRASLESLYVESGLGPAQDISHSAITTHAMQKAIESNVRAVRNTICRLKQNDRQLLFEKCHGR